jgi:AraC-like DNA-binding protein
METPPRPAGQAASSSQTASLVNWSGMRLGVYWAYEGTPAATRSTTRVDAQTAWLLTAGRVQFRYRGQDVAARAGSWIILGANREEHEFSEQARLLSICFRAEWLTGRAFFDDSVPIVLQAHAHPKLERFARRLARSSTHVAPAAGADLMRQRTTFAKYLSLQQAYFGWLSELSETLQRAGRLADATGPADERVIQAVRLLDQWPLDEALDEHVVARQVGVSKSHLHRLVSVQAGVSPHAYLEKRRLKAARERLLHESLPVKTIAYQLGFHDTSHFTNWFKQRTGSTPTHFRKHFTSPWEYA